MATASRVVISYPADLSDWSADQLRTPWFERYLRKTLGEIHQDDEFEEFVDIGCCGNSLDIPLRIESIEDGTKVGDATVIDWTTRAACDVDGGWTAQSTHH